MGGGSYWEEALTGRGKYFQSLGGVTCEENVWMKIPPDHGKMPTMAPQVSFRCCRSPKNRALFSAPPPYVHIPASLLANTIYIFSHLNFNPIEFCASEILSYSLVSVGDFLLFSLSRKEKRNNFYIIRKVHIARL